MVSASHVWWASQLHGEWSAINATEVLWEVRMMSLIIPANMPLSQDDDKVMFLKLLHGLCH